MGRIQSVNIIHPLSCEQFIVTSTVHTMSGYYEYMYVLMCFVALLEAANAMIFSFIELRLIPGKAEEVFFKTGFCNWNNRGRGLASHNSSQYHREAVLNLASSNGYSIYTSNWSRG